MLLSEYVARKKIEDRSFRQDHFARKLKISPVTFSKIKNLKYVPSGKVAYAIEQETNGQVKGWDMIVRCVEMMKKEKRK